MLRRTLLNTVLAGVFLAGSPSIAGTTDPDRLTVQNTPIVQFYGGINPFYGGINPF